jgi:hypothetical protein
MLVEPHYRNMASCDLDLVSVLTCTTQTHICVGKGHVLLKFDYFCHGV